jgi:hypothetical protein
MTDAELDNCGLNQDMERELRHRQSQKRLQAIDESQAGLQATLDQIAKPSRLLWWTFSIAVLTLVVSVIGYWDQILRLIQALRLLLSGSGMQPH